AEEARELERKDDVAIEVLVQAVVAARFVAQHERRRLRLAVLAAASQQRREIRREEVGVAEGRLPLVGDGGQRRVRALAQRLHERRQRRREVFVLADAETVPGHVDPAAEAALVAVERREVGALVRREHGRCLRVAVLPHRALDGRPVEGVQSLADVRHALTLPRRQPCAHGLQYSREASTGKTLIRRWRRWRGTARARAKMVKSAMRRRKSGTLKSGRSGKRVTSRKQAIAIGLSEARKKDAKVPRRDKRPTSDMGGPEMAPHTPHTLGAPRQSRGTPRYPTAD